MALQGSAICGIILRSKETKRYVLNHERERFVEERRELLERRQFRKRMGQKLL